MTDVVVVMSSQRIGVVGIFRPFSFVLRIAMLGDHPDCALLF